MGRQPASRHVARFDPAAFHTLHDFGGLERAITWHNMSFDRAKGCGSHLMVMTPGASSRPHRHSGAEEVLVLEIGLVHFDGYVYRAGDFVRLDKGTAHTSLSPGGCRLVVTGWGHTQPVGIEHLEPLS